MILYREYDFGTYMWEDEDLRMVMDDFGELQIVPFCCGIFEIQQYFSVI